MICKQIDNNSWIVYTQENGKNKEILIKFPVDSIDQMGYYEDDDLNWFKEVDIQKIYVKLKHD